MEEALENGKESSHSARRWNEWMNEWIYSFYSHNDKMQMWKCYLRLFVKLQYYMCGFEYTSFSLHLLNSCRSQRKPKFMPHLGTEENLYIYAGKTQHLHLARPTGYRKINTDNSCHAWRTIQCTITPYN
jgi:hypothetical protein